MSRRIRKKQISGWFIIVLLVLSLVLGFFVFGIKLSEFTLAYGGVNIKCYDIPDEVKYGDDLVFKIQVSDTRNIESNKAKYSFINLKISPSGYENIYIFKQYIWLRAGESENLEVNIPSKSLRREGVIKYSIKVKADITLYEYSPLTGTISLSFSPSESTAKSDDYEVFADYNLESGSIKYKGAIRVGEIVTTITTTRTEPKVSIPIVTTTTTARVIRTIPKEITLPKVTTSYLVTRTYSYKTYVRTATYWIHTWYYQPQQPIALSVLEQGLEGDRVSLSAGQRTFETNWIKWDGFSFNLFETLKSSRKGKEENIWQYGADVGAKTSFGYLAKLIISTPNARYVYKGYVPIQSSCSHDFVSKEVSIPFITGRYEVSAPKEVVVNEGESPKTAEIKLKITNILSKTAVYYIYVDGKNKGGVKLNSGETKEVVVWSKTYSYYDYMKDVDTYDKLTIELKISVDGYFVQTKDIEVSIHIIIKSKPSVITAPTMTTTTQITTSTILKGEEGKIIYVDVPNQVYYDQPYTIIATAKNTGDKEGDIRVAITPYGSIEESGQIKRLKAGETFTYSKEDVVFKGGIASKTWVITASIRDPANPNFWKTTDSKTITINFVQKPEVVDSKAEKNKAYLGTEKITITSNIPVEVLLDGKNVKSGDSIELPKTTHELIAPNKVTYNNEIYELKRIMWSGNIIGYRSPVYFSGISGTLELVYEKSVANNITGGKTVDVSGSETKIAEVTSTKTTYKEEVKDGETKQVLVDESSKEKVEMKPPEKKLEIPLINIILFAVIGILLFGIIYLIIKMFKTKGRVR